MLVTKIVNSFFSSNTFVLTEEGVNDCWLVDVGDIEPIMEIIENREVKGVFITHSHYDHIYGINKLVERFPNCIVYTSLNGMEGLFSDKLNFSRYNDDSIIFKGGPMKVLEEGDEVMLFPNVVLRAIYTPGHDWSCMSFKVENNLFTGDSYIPGIKVVTNFPKSNKEQAVESFVRLQEMEKMYGYTICAGHSSNLNK